MRSQRFHGVEFVAGSAVKGLDVANLGSLELAGGDLPSLPYFNRTDLRTTTGAIGKTILVQNLGLFSLQEGSADVDDAETCFINTDGNSWKLETTHYELVEVLINEAIANSQTTFTAADIRAAAPWLWRVQFVPKITTVYDGSTATETVSAPMFTMSDNLKVTVGPALASITEGYNITAAMISDGNIQITYINGPDGSATFNPSNHIVIIDAY